MVGISGPPQGILSVLPRKTPWKPLMSPLPPPDASGQGYVRRARILMFSPFIVNRLQVTGTPEGHPAVLGGLLDGSDQTGSGTFSDSGSGRDGGVTNL
ncbi:hypothetical protein GCM10022225_21420 [Plantactinospora mayteni]|uniref:Uncharacterized protein n=1 Tax=Plantactinospora mayteni TaxID=566021 RepID=A0ABQ4ENV6_9ACTN|nr:hypothetical protein Pma05_28960 [Plantactinospora mayteni]